jgi:hypothetical protein
MMIPTGPGETRLLPRGAIASHNWAAWTPDGRRIVMGANEAGRGSRLYVQAVDGEDPSPITGEGVRLSTYAAHAVSPDGRLVIGLSPEGEPTLYPIAGGAPQLIPSLGQDLVPVGWSDTPNVLYARPRGLGRLVDIYRVDIVSGRRERWRTVGQSDRTGAPRVFVVQVAPDGRRYVYGSVESMHDLFLISGVLQP